MRRCPAGLRDHAQQESRRTRVERRAGALDDDRVRPPRADSCRSGAGRSKAAVATPRSRQPAYGLRDRRRVRLDADSARAARARSAADARARSRPCVVASTASPASPCARAASSRRDTTAAQAPVGQAGAAAQRALIAEESRDGDLCADARQRFGVADFERERRSHDASAPRRAPSVCATASSTPFTKAGDGSAPKRRASSTASSIATAGGQARPAHLVDGQAQHVAVDRGHALDAPVGARAPRSAGRSPRAARATPSASSRA